MSWFHQGPCFSFLLWLTTLVILETPVRLGEEVEPGANLAHICANLGSIPEEGVPVILLHEYASTKESWNGIYQNIPFLSHRRVCVYDARNHGDSPWNDTFTIDVLAEDLENFMRAMKIEKAAFVGHGQGAYTAMRLALRNADKVERIFVEDVSPIDVPKEAIAGIEKYVTALRDSIREVPGDADEEAVRKAIIKYVLQETEGIFQVPAESFPEKIPIRLKDGKWEWKMNMEVLMKPFDDPAAYLGKMEGRYDGKVFFIYGKESPYNVGRDVEAIIKLFPNSEFLGIEGGGHFIHSEHRQFVLELIKFLH